MEQKNNFQAIARQVFAIEAEAVAGLVSSLDAQFDACVEAMLASTGRVIVCGMGKSGIIAKKIAATFASTGTPSFFMHPGEAYHGDLGMVTPDDVFIAISNSGETEEVIKLLPFLVENGNPLIAMTGNAASNLAKSCHWHLNISVKQEACPLQLAPTSSTTAALVMGDALAITLMKARGFAPEQFARFHPGGNLGRRLLRRVVDEMQVDRLPFVNSAADMLTVISVMSEGGLGIAIVMEEGGDQCGIITDGDVRRAIAHYGHEVFNQTAGQLQIANPSSVAPETRVEDALALMESRQITRLLVKEQHVVIGVFKK